MGVPIGTLSFTPFSGRNGSGSITVTGTKAGDLVAGIYYNNHWTPPYPSGVFESVITVDDQIQQLSASDFSSDTFTLVVFRKL